MVLAQVVFDLVFKCWCWLHWGRPALVWELDLGTPGCCCCPTLLLLHSSPRAIHLAESHDGRAASTLSAIIEQPFLFVTSVIFLAVLKNLPYRKMLLLLCVRTGW